MASPKHPDEYGSFFGKLDWYVTTIEYCGLFIDAFTAGLILGIALLVTFAISIGAIVQRNHVTTGLVILNYTLLIDAIGIVIIGTFVWFFTLEERNNFHKSWQAATPTTRRVLQDQVRFLLLTQETLQTKPSSSSAVAISMGLIYPKLGASANPPISSLVLMPLYLLISALHPSPILRI